MAETPTKGLGKAEIPTSRIDPASSNDIVKTTDLPIPSTMTPTITSETKNKENSSRYPIEYGSIKPVSSTMNPAVMRAAAAVISGKDHAALSPLFPARPFNLEEWRRDSSIYCSTTEPGRAFMSATPGPNVPILLPIGPSSWLIRQDETIRLQVRVPPKAPCSFSSFDAGLFKNHLTSITVSANDQGIAFADFTPGSGVVSGILIQAASPLASGQIQFRIDVLPNQSSTQSGLSFPKKESP